MAERAVMMWMLMLMLLILQTMTLVLETPQPGRTETAERAQLLPSDDNDIDNGGLVEPLARFVVRI